MKWRQKDAAPRVARSVWETNTKKRVDVRCTHDQVTCMHSHKLSSQSLALSSLWNFICLILYIFVTEKSWGSFQSFDFNVVNLNIVSFFEINDLLHPPVRQAILTNLEPGNTGNVNYYSMTCASLCWPRLERSRRSAIPAHILSMFHYDESDRVIRQREDVPLFTCGRRWRTEQCGARSSHLCRRTNGTWSAEIWNTALW